MKMDYGCLLSNGVTTQHSCEYIYATALFGHIFFILLKVGLIVAIIWWICWVTTEIRKRKK